MEAFVLLVWRLGLGKCAECLGKMGGGIGWGHGDYLMMKKWMG